MITEDFVSFETAKLLRDNGFNGVCYFIYRDDGTLFYCATHRAQPTTNKNIAEDNEKNPKFKVYECTCPTQQMARKWLRETHKIDIAIYPYGEYTCDNYQFDVYKDQRLIISKDDGFMQYEQALEAAIKYCLEKLV